MKKKKKNEMYYEIVKMYQSSIFKLWGWGYEFIYTDFVSLYLTTHKMNNTSYDNMTSTFNTGNCPQCICQCPNDTYTQLGIFISGLILSISGLASICLIGCRKSNCSEIKIGPLKLKRDNLRISEVWCFVSLTYIRIAYTSYQNLCGEIFSSRW